MFPLESKYSLWGIFQYIQMAQTKTTGERRERKRMGNYGDLKKPTEITVSKPPVHFEVNLFHFY